MFRNRNEVTSITEIWKSLKRGKTQQTKVTNKSNLSHAKKHRTD